MFKNIWIGVIIIIGNIIFMYLLIVNDKGSYEFER